MVLILYEINLKIEKFENISFHLILKFQHIFKQVISQLQLKILEILLILYKINLKFKIELRSYEFLFTGNLIQISTESFRISIENFCKAFGIYEIESS